MYQQIMNSFLSENIFKSIQKISYITLISLFLTACVTQEYKADNSPVIVNPVKNDEIAMTRIQLGLGYLKMGNTTQAKLNLEKAKRIAPNLVQVYTAFAHYYDQVGEVDLTINSYEKALAIKSDDADTLNNYGVFLCSQNKIDAAEKQLLKAIAVPSYLLVSQSYENIALCELKVNNFAKAEKYLKKSIEHSPNNTSAIIQMAQLQYAKKDYLEAEKYLKRFEKVTRHFSPLPLALAYKVYRKQGKSSIAKNYAAMLVKMFPQSYQTKQYLKNGLAHTEADNLAEKYQQLIVKQQPSKAKKRVFKLSPNHSKKLIVTSAKTPFKVTSSLSSLPITRSVKAEEKSDIDKPKEEMVISDEMMETLINENVSKSSSKNNAKVKSKSTNIVDDTIDDLVTKDIVSDVATNDTNDNKSKNSAEQQVDNTVTKDIVSDVATNDTNDNKSKNSAEQQVDNTVNNDMSDNNSSNDATDRAIDAAINQLVVGEVNKDVSDEKSTIKNKLVNDVDKNLTPLTHVIKKDQNLFYISRTYNIRLSALRRWNHLTKNSVLQVGDIIYLVDPATIKTSNKVQSPND
jgi:type IV pilus assembly protein PilF